MQLQIWEISNANTGENNGEWMTMLPQINDVQRGITMSVSGDTSTLTISNVAVGQVWLLSGQ